MLRWLPLVRTGIVASVLAGLPSLADSQPPAAKPVPLFNPAPLDEKQVQAWARESVGRIDAIWTEAKAGERERQLDRLSENTPADLAFVTRVLKRNQPGLGTAALAAVRDVFAVLRRTTWQEGDAVYVQRVVAGWSVMIPDLIKIIGQDGSTTEMRRLAERILTDLALLSRDARLGSEQARLAWSPQLKPLADLTNHTKPTVRQGALHVLKALGRDAQPVALAVVQALADPDPFVRWTAVEALKTIGMDQSARQSVAVMQHDDDADVRKAAVEAVLCEPGGADVLARTRQASPIRSVALVQPAPTPKKPAPPPPRAPLEQPRALEQNTAKTVEAGMPVLKQSAPPRVATSSSIPSAERSKAPLQSSQLRHVFTSSTPTTESPVARSASPPAGRTLDEPAPALPVRSERAAAPAPLLLVPQATPKYIPATTSVETVTVDVTQLWLKQLTGSSADQVRALRELAKMKQVAGHCVPQMAELLVKGDVTVRREVPLALLEIGAPAKIATALLERALQDDDTEVKINAARCLVELSTR